MLTKYKLEELIEVTRGMSLPGENYSESGELIRLTLGNFNYNGGGFKENTSKSDIFYVGEVRPEFILNKGDIITPLTEQTIGLLGSTAMIPESGKYIQSQDVALITPDANKLDHLFCYYLISSDVVRKQLSAAAQQTKIRHTSPDKIKECTVWIPEMETQKKIGKILFDIDQQITLNTRMNAELEAMVKQLYDYWFVQFDFPDENGKPYKSFGGKMVWNEKLKREIPEGWEVKTLASICGKITSGRRPSGGIDKNLRKGIPSLGAECIDTLGVFNFTSTPYVLEEYREYTSCGIIEDNDILIYKDGAYVGKVTLFRDNFPFEYATVNEHVFLFHAKDNIYQEYVFYTLVSKTYFAIMQNAGKAKAAQPGLNREDFLSIELLYPEVSVVNNFHNVVDKLHERLFCDAKQNKELLFLRDSLLPMLMNGQVDVKE